MTWSNKRKLTYIGIITVIFGVSLFFYLYPKFNVAPTCMDEKQNGTEHGVDCGGLCQKMCLSETTPLSIKWARPFEVADGYYNAVAYIENQNLAAAAEMVNYEFRLYDDQNLFVASREGTTYIPPNSRFAIFEPTIAVGNRIPKTALFRFTTTPTWLNVKGKFPEIKLLTSAEPPTDLDTTPKVRAEIKNDSLTRVDGLDVVAIVYDAESNGIGASKTRVDSLLAGATRSLSFTWRAPFSGSPKRVELVPVYNPFLQEK